MARFIANKPHRGHDIVIDIAFRRNNFHWFVVRSRAHSYSVVESMYNLFYSHRRRRSVDVSMWHRCVYHMEQHCSRSPLARDCPLTKLCGILCCSNFQVFSMCAMRIHLVAALVELVSSPSSALPQSTIFQSINVSTQTSSGPSCARKRKMWNVKCKKRKPNGKIKFNWTIRMDSSGRLYRFWFIR